MGRSLNPGRWRVFLKQCLSPPAPAGPRCPGCLRLPGHSSRLSPRGLPSAPHFQEGPGGSNGDVRSLLAGARAVLPEDIREIMQWTSESAVQENVSSNGQAWKEPTDDCFMDSDIKVLEDEFDEFMIEVTTKRRQYPRRILESVIRALKAQHESLKQYHPVVHNLDLKCDPGPAAHMEDSKYRREAITKEMSQALKALPVSIEQADGLSQVLKMRPTIQLQKTNQEVFSCLDRKADSKPDHCVTHGETTPTKTVARKATNIVLKGKQAPDCTQRKRYPLRLKRINLNM